MRIFNGMRDVRQRYPARKEAAELERAEIISDIFNNQAESDREEGPVKVRLSNASRKLMGDLRHELAQFLKDRPAVSEALDEISIPEEGWLAGDLTLRKLGAYLRWLDMQSGEGQEPSGEEEVYKRLHSQGIESDLREIFAKNLEKVREAKAGRAKNVPNYYYLVYPETYSFN